MKTAVITFPGSNCDEDVRSALTRAFGVESERLWHTESRDLSGFDLVVLPGGFSYGDYLRCGAIAARSPIVQSVIKFADQGGFVLGICNGFQILCEAGLLPGALARNESRQFVCSDTLLAVENRETPWTSAIPFQKDLSIPIAHGDGRYLVDDGELLRMRERGQIIFRYHGVNPNGSLDGIAGICNGAKNVLGLMPHPERASYLGSGDGNWIWKSIQAAGAKPKRGRDRR